MKRILTMPAITHLAATLHAQAESEAKERERSAAVRTFIKVLSCKHESDPAGRSLGTRTRLKPS